jgi:hypothetical protein
MSKKKHQTETPVEEPTKEEIHVEEASKECPAEACEELRALWTKGIYGCFDPNSDSCNSCCEDFPELGEICKSGTTSKAARREAKKTAEIRTKVPGKKGEKIRYMENLIEEGCYTRDQIVDMYVEKWGGSPLTPKTLLSDGKNPKQLGTRYNPFGRVIVQTGKVLGFAS